MPHVAKAQDLPAAYYFEICDAEAGACPGEGHQHRVYNWGKQDLTCEDNPCTCAVACFHEVRLLEAERLVRLPHGRTPLPVQDQTL